MHSPTASRGGRRERWSSKLCERSTHIRPKEPPATHGHAYWNGPTARYFPE
jgi:hypothetical protein